MAKETYPETASLVRRQEARVRIASRPPIPFPAPGHVETVEKKNSATHISEKLKKASKTGLSGLSNSEGAPKI